MILLSRLSKQYFTRNVRPSRLSQPAPAETKAKNTVENKDKIKALLENKFEAKEVDRLIEQKIQEGKNDKQIVQELLGMPKRLSTHEQYLIRDKERIKKHRLDISGIFDIDKSALSNMMNEPMGKEELAVLKMKKENRSRAHKEMVMYTQQMELIQEIEENSSMKKLFQGGLVQRASNKMSKIEKDEMKINLAIMRQDILDRRELPPKEYLQRKQMEIKTYQYIPQEEIEEIHKETEQNKEKSKQVLMTELQSKKESHVKQGTKEGLLQQLSNLAKVDSDKSDKGLEIYYDDHKEGDRHKKREKVRPYTQLATLQKQQKGYEKMIMEHGINEDFLEDLADLETEMLFQEKARQEKDKAFEEGMKKRQQRKKVKELEKELSKRELAEDMDWQQENKVGRVRQDKEYGGMVPDLAQWEAVEEHHRNTIDHSTDRLDQQYEYHRERTTRNYEKFIRQYVTESNKSSILSVTNGYKIDLKEVITNNAITVAYVFWDYRPQVEQDKTISQENTPKIEQNLIKYSKVIRGIMCRELGLKYAPDVRFVKSEREQQVANMLQDVKKQVPKMVMQEIETDFIEGKQKDPQYKRLYSKDELNTMCNDYYETIQQGVQSQTNHDQQVSQIRRAKQQARVRDNRNTDGTKKKKKRDKQHRFNTFWESLDE